MERVNKFTTLLSVREKTREDVRDTLCRPYDPYFRAE